MTEPSGANAAGSDQLQLDILRTNKFEHVYKTIAQHAYNFYEEEVEGLTLDNVYRGRVKESDPALFEDQPCTGFQIEDPSFALKLEHHVSGECYLL